MFDGTVLTACIHPLQNNKDRVLFLGIKYILKFAQPFAKAIRLGLGLLFAFECARIHRISTA
ncbi:hypothetical protein D3C72_1984930 [compost metagenome]